jgi:hypothetical protein
MRYKEARNPMVPGLSHERTYRRKRDGLGIVCELAGGALRAKDENLVAPRRRSHRVRLPARLVGVVRPAALRAVDAG